ncbi:MAG: hypothetical protein JWM54_1696, partial [Acidobacteriaceae bacterium]|nr:hypothetical protein [Acidobacteriaceae bacterium]
MFGITVRETQLLSGISVVLAMGAAGV